MSKKKNVIPNDLRKAVLKRDNYTCRYCGSQETPLHCDHVYPESKGGATVYQNLVTACARCNVRKHAKIGIWPLPNDLSEQLKNIHSDYEQKIESVEMSFTKMLNDAGILNRQLVMELKRIRSSCEDNVLQYVTMINELETGYEVAIRDFMDGYEVRIFDLKSGYEVQIKDLERTVADNLIVIDGIRSWYSVDGVEPPKAVLVGAYALFLWFVGYLIMSLIPSLQQFKDVMENKILISLLFPMVVSYMLYKVWSIKNLYANIRG